MIITEYAGDLFTADVDYIAHQCNTTTTRSAGLAREMFRRYPDANTYIAGERMIGTASLHGRVVNLYAQIAPGRAQRFGRDTEDARLAYFFTALMHAKTLIEAERQTFSIAVPRLIGCDLAGGDWTRYHDALCRFARNNPHVTVHVVELVKK